jgi:hypothetical protein
MFVLNATLDFETGDYVISVENMDPFIVENGIIVGKLQGEITGTATPKIHLS